MSVLAILVAQTSLRSAASAAPSPSPTATPTPILRAGGADGLNGVAGDCNQNAVVTIDELIRGVNIALDRQPLGNCPAFDTNGNGRVTVDELIQGVNVALHGAPPTFTPTQIISGGLVTLRDSSPANGESGVAVTRETILRFDGPIDPDSVTEQSIAAVYGGGSLFARRHVSPDQRTVTLFYETFLPASARVRVMVNGGLLRAAGGGGVDPDGDGQAGGVAIIDFDTLNLTTLPGTAVCGRVFASELIPGENGTAMNVPLAGVTIDVDGAPDLQAVTDQLGNFRLDPAPVGRFFVFIRGTTATVGVPLGAYYPNVGKAWQSVAGVETNIGDIFLPLIDAGTLQPVSLTGDTVVRFPDSVRNDFPELADVELMVPADSLYSNDGTRGGMVGIAPVSPDRLPSRLPAGLDFPLVITVQTDGGENFDKPVPVCFPNLPDRTTGLPLAPGAPSALWSFNHDTGQFEVVGSMHVTADGKLVCTDPGVGIRAPGWHGSAPGAGGGGGPLGGPPGPNDNDKGSGSPPPGAPSKAKCKKKGPDNDDNVDPVYLFSGEFHEEVTDLRVPGRGLDFIWSRKYRSKIGPNTTQGNGWDFSYNIFIAGQGADIRVCDGNSRSDTYFRIPRTVAAQGASAGAAVVSPGFRRSEFFRQVDQNSDNSFTMTFADSGTWVFNPLDGGPEGGKIQSIADRNGNTLTFAYDQTGRVNKVTDTLGRDFLIAYNADGFIESVTDFSRRQVRYTYYQDGEAGGSFGDLKSVRSPVVTDTPNGNDFPNGKLTTYTYSKGFTDDRLNHNLLTITDARRNDPNDSTFGDGPYLVNVYGDTEDPADVNFDRVVRQFWGGPTDVADMVYIPQTASAQNRQAVMKTIVRDRVGNVSEYFFDVGNRVVTRREYTGRANPQQPTTETANRPKNKLRPDDPDFFETLYDWNQDSQMTRVVYPNGDSTEYVYESDLNPDAPPRMRGNLRVRRHFPGPLAQLSDQQMIEELFEYDSRFGCGVCGPQFVTRHVDGRQNETLHQYDEHGNRTKTIHRIKKIVDEYEHNEFGQLTAHTLPANDSGHRRRDEYRYYDSGPQRGYMRQEVADAHGLDLTVNYEYDAVGNIIRQTDPRGHAASYDVNQLNQMVRATSREVSDGSGLRYHHEYFYDANNNVVRIDIENLDENGTVVGNGKLTRTFDYELLNRLVRRSDAVDAGHAIVTEYDYDANRNLTLTRYGEATAGRQAGNTQRVLYDERDLVFRVIDGEGTAEQRTTQQDYDRNGNRSAVRQGLENAPRVSTVQYDGFNRGVHVTDPMGNVAILHYDANGNPSSARVEGELQDVVGSTANVRLSEATYTFDPDDRLTRQDEAFFNTQTQAAIGDGSVTNQLALSDSSQVVTITDDNGHVTGFAYDPANRLHVATDPAGDTFTFDYDENSNTRSVTQRDKSDLGTPDDTFVSRFSYDNLNRLVQSVDPAGAMHQYFYDSRDDAVRHIDAKGNATQTTFDGVRRPVAIVTELRDTGDGSGTVVGSHTMELGWDDSSRLVSRTDDNGHPTGYVYDAVNRRMEVQYADGTNQTRTFNVHDELIELRDANGNVVRNTTFDLVGRVIQRTIQRGPGVLGPTAETFAYDGLSRVVDAEDDDATVTRQYDSQSNVVSETLNGETTASAFDGAHNQLSSRYPGGREIDNTYDAVDRIHTVADDRGNLATYAYAGTDRVQQRDFRNGARMTNEYDAARRTTRTTHTRIGATPAVLDDNKTTWDPNSNKTSRTDLLPGGRSHTYGHDSLQRLVHSELVPPSGPSESIDYTLDGVDNRVRVTGGAQGGDYVLSTGAPGPADAPVNQYTRTPFDTRTYDANGNLTGIDTPPLGGAPEVTLAYDYRNHMVRYADARSNVTTTYAYDALGRRIEKVVDDGTPETTRFFYDRWRVVEEQNGTGATQATYAYGSYLDDILNMRRGGNDFFFHADDMLNVTAVSDANGVVVERYDYGDYGEPFIFDAARAARAGSAIGNPYLFHGRRLDTESGFYDYRTRYLDPRAGRFTTRDSIGVWGDPMNRGSAFAYVGSNPLSRVDPMGRCPLLLAILAGAAEVGVEGGGVALAVGAGEGALATGTAAAAGGAAATAGAGSAVAAGTVAETLGAGLTAQAAVSAEIAAGGGGAALAEGVTAAAGGGVSAAGSAGATAAGLGILDQLWDLATEPPGTGGASGSWDDDFDEPTLPGIPPGIPVPLGPNGTEPDFPALPSEPNPFGNDQCVEPGPDGPGEPGTGPTNDDPNQPDQTPASGPDVPNAPAPRPLPEPEPMTPIEPIEPGEPPVITPIKPSQAETDLVESLQKSFPSLPVPGTGGRAVQIE